MLFPWRTTGVCLVVLVLSLFCTSCGVTLLGHLSYASEASDPLASYTLTGDTLPILDPSVIRQGSGYYAFSTDVAGFPAEGNLPIHCSHDKVKWTACGSVFPAGIPAWVQEKVPGVAGLWAPDVSWFNGEYHLYYNGSTLHSQQTVIGLVTHTRSIPPIRRTSGWTGARCWSRIPGTTSTRCFVGA